ncbi:MAG: hypothetical protein ACRENP_07600 [Longimicrobiales bacterium]
MTPFEYLSVLISIVLGLGLTQLLANVHKLVQARARVQLYWLSILWAILIFIAQVEWWWANFSLRGPESNFFYFLFVLLSPVALYLISASVLPSIEPGVSYDLRVHYYGTRRWFFGVLALQLIFDAVRRGMQAGSFTDFGALSNALSAVVLGVLAITEKQWYHVTITLAVTALFLFFVASQALELLRI